MSEFMERRAMNNEYHVPTGEDVDSATEDEEEVEDEEEEKEDNPLLVKEKKEKIDKTNLWFNKVEKAALDLSGKFNLNVAARSDFF